MLPVNFQFEEIMADFSAKGRSNVAGEGGQGQTVSFEDLMKRIGNAMHERQQAGKAVDGNGLKGVDKRNGETGTQQIIQAVKKHLFARDIDPRSIKLNKASLDTLTDIFESAGLNGEALSDLFRDIMSDSASGTLTLADILTAMDTRAETLKGAGQSVRLDSSTIPYFKTILNRLGMNRETAGEIMEKAVSKDGGVDVRALVSALKDFADQQAGGNPITISGEKDAREELAVLLSRIGIKTGEKGDAPVTLKSVIQGLENMVTDKQPAVLPQHQLAHQIDRFMKAVESANTTADGKTDNEKISLLGENTLKSRIRGGTTANRENQTGTDAREVAKDGGKAADAASDQKLFRQALAARQADSSSGNLANRMTDARGQNMAAGVGQAGAGVGHTGQTGSAPTAEKPLPAYVLNQVGRQVVKAVQNNQNTVTIQLKPPQLGRLAISIETSGNTLKVNIMAEQSAARDLLMSHSSDLKAVVSEQHHGLRVEKVDVQLSQNFDQAMADARNGKDQNGAGSRRKGNVRPGVSSVNEKINADDGGPEQTERPAGSGLLNLIA